MYNQNWEIIFCLTENVMVSMLFCEYLHSRRNKTITFILQVILMLAVYLAALEADNLVVNIWKIHYPMSDKFALKAVLSMLGLYLIGRALYSDKPFKLLKPYLIFMLLGIVLEIVVTFIAGIALHEDIGRNSDWTLRFSLRCLTSLAFSALFIIVLGFKQHYDKNELTALCILQLGLLICDYSTVFFFYKGQYSFISKHPGDIMFFYTIPALIVNFLTAWILHKLSAIHDLESKLKYEEKLGENQWKYYQVALENEDRMNSLKEEIGRQFQNVQSLIQQGKTENVQEMSERMTDRLSKVTSMWYCDNPIVNIIISIKSEEAKKQGVELKTRITADLGNIAISEIDLSSILTNLLDNAIREEAMQNRDERVVICSIAEKQQQLIMYIANHTSIKASKAEIQHLKTTKKHAGDHGIGLSLVRRIVESYGGSMQMEINDGLFETTIICCFADIASAG